jgi:hypothetical protein
LVISLAVAASTVRAVLSERCPDLLAENGGPVKVSQSWVSSLDVRQPTMDLPQQQDFSVRETEKHFPIPLREVEK